MARRPSRRFFQTPLHYTMTSCSNPLDNLTFSQSCDWQEIKNSRATEKPTRRIKPLTKAQLICTGAETSGDEDIGVRSFSPVLHTVVTSIKVFSAAFQVLSGSGQCFALSLCVSVLIRCVKS